MKINLVKVGGICAILTVAIALARMIIFVVMMGEPPQSEEMEYWAPFAVDNRGVILTRDWLTMLVLIFESAAVVGFFYVLREAGPLTWLGLAAWLTGLQLVMFEHILVLGANFELMPQYVAASSAVRPALDVLTSTLHRTALLAALVGNTLILGVGVPVFAFAVLRTRRARRWIGWLGLVVAVMTWVGIGSVLPGYPPVLSAIGGVGFVGFRVWLVAMGVTWLRMGDSAGNSSGDL